MVAANIARSARTDLSMKVLPRFLSHSDRTWTAVVNAPG
jgi:hypothetical protein